jgi:hypothetical protein
MSQITVENHVAYFDLHDADTHHREVAVFGAQLLMSDSLIARQPRVAAGRIIGFRLPLPDGDPYADDVIKKLSSALEPTSVV